MTAARTPVTGATPVSQPLFPTPRGAAPCASSVASASSRPALSARFGTAAALAAAMLVGASAVAQTPQATLFGDHAADASGAALATLPDLDGDGRAELIVGAPGDGSQAERTVRVRRSSDGGLLLRLVDKTPGARFGAAVAGLADVNADGLPDLAVGSPGSAPGPGRVRLFSAADGAVLLDLFSGGNDSWDGFGAALAPLADIDGDGASDLFVGAPSLSDEQPGSASIRSGATGAVLATYVGLAPGDRFGAALSGVGDVNADGTDDLLIGAPAGGYAQVRSGADGSVLLQLIGTGGDFGAAVAAAGDVDGDGHADLAVGAPGLSRVDVLSGANGSLLRRVSREGAFGAAIAAAGDWNGDGTEDFLVGAPEETVAGGLGAGSVYAISGAQGDVLFKAPGAAAGEHQGAAVAVLGTAGPGVKPDLAVGATGLVGPAAEASGGTRLYAGKLVGSIVPYGIGCPGSFLITPRLDLSGDPYPGAQVKLAITKALGGSFALLFVGGGQGLTPFMNGCILWVAPVLVPPITLPLDGPGPGAGNITLTERLPEQLPVGFVVTMQAVVADPGADGGLSSTSAIQLTIQ